MANPQAGDVGFSCFFHLPSLLRFAFWYIVFDRQQHRITQKQSKRELIDNVSLERQLSSNSWLLIAELILAAEPSPVCSDCRELILFVQGDCFFNNICVAHRRSLGDGLFPSAQRTGLVYP